MIKVRLFLAKCLLHCIQDSLLACLVISFLLRILLFERCEDCPSLQYLSLLEACLHLLVIVVIEPAI